MKVQGGKLVDELVQLTSQKQLGRTKSRGEGVNQVKILKTSIILILI